MGGWRTSEASLEKNDPVVHYVFDADKEAYCGRTSHFNGASTGRYCMFCLVYLIKDGFMRTVLTGGGTRANHKPRGT